MNLGDSGLVRLISSDGAVVELQPVSYQFSRPPGTRGAEGSSTTGSYADWDANWLVICGDIRTSDGQSWTFMDACLTTWEAEQLSLWLRAAGSDNAAAGLDPAVFTEPNLSFFLDGVQAGRVRMRLRLSHESLPRRLRWEASGGEASEHDIALEVSGADLAEAAQAWDRDRLPFPAR